MSAIVIFNNNFRFEDNQSFYEASLNHERVIPLYIHDENIAIGAASRWWLERTLENFNHQFKEKYNSQLNMLEGDLCRIIEYIVDHYSITHIYYNKSYDREFKKIEANLIEKFKSRLILNAYDDNLLLPMHTVKNKNNLHYNVFTPFSKELLTRKIRETFPLPRKANFVLIEDAYLKQYQFKTQEKWHYKIGKYWSVGEKEANLKLSTLIEKVQNYDLHRNLPHIEGTSKLSPHLHFGEISPVKIYNVLRASQIEDYQMSRGADSFLNEIIWREFSYNTLARYPEVDKEPIDKKFNAFPWSGSENYYEAWIKGMTGYPIVDAGMRELWETGWMHNRVRMIVGSFLIKDLFIHWRRGEDWFFDCLVDADLAINSCSWQWVAGCGLDAAPFFRIFNPVLQGQKFDPDGVYVKKWIPQIRHVSVKNIHTPWKELNPNKYPVPLVNHDIQRKLALSSYHDIKNKEN